MNPLQEIITNEQYQTLKKNNLLDPVKVRNFTMLNVYRRIKPKYSTKEIFNLFSEVIFLDWQTMKQLIWNTKKYKKHQSDILEIAEKLTELQ